MSARLKRALLMYHHQVKKNLEALRTIMSVERKNYIKLRQAKILNIFRLQRKRILILAKLLTAKKRKRIWAKSRTSTFWEKDIAENGDEFFKENFRISRSTFKLLCSKLQVLQKHDTSLRKCVPLDKRIAIALYILGSSAEYLKVSVLFGIGKGTVCYIFKSFCQAVWDVLSPIYLNTYEITEKSVEENINGFEKLGFPQCFGAIDSCHIEVRKGALEYRSSKGLFSIVLLAVVDCRHRFLNIDVGSPGSRKDSQIFDDSELKKQYQQNTILKEKSRNICGVNVPVTLIGDSSFQLSDIMMTPYAGSITDSTEEKTQFNKALSKCLNVVDTAFVQLKTRFRRIDKTLDNNIDNTCVIIKACCALHNFCVANNDNVNVWLQDNDDNLSRKQTKFTVQSSEHNDSVELMRNAICRYISALEVDGTSSLGFSKERLSDLSAVSEASKSEGLGEAEFLLSDAVDSEDPLNG